MSHSEKGNREYEKVRFTVPHHILRSELIYGDGFQSPGGLAAFQETVLPELSLSTGNRLLDIGSGLGGAAFHLVAKNMVKVVGVDSAELMISIANSRREQLDPGGGTHFIHGSVFCNALEPGSFDVIYSQDTLLYVANKPKVLARCAELLKPGGTLLINDFCQGQKTPKFDEYVDVSGMHLVDIPAYKEMVINAGFMDVTARDISTTTAHRLERDLNAYLIRAQHDSQIGEVDVQHLVNRWRRKISFIVTGAMTQGLFRAVTPC